MKNLNIGDKVYHGKFQVTIISLLENDIVEVLGNENGIPFNYKVPIFDLTEDLVKQDFFFF